LYLYLFYLYAYLFITLLTEITSNTVIVTATLLMPILAAAMNASCAFMLPVATAPNAIMYGMDKFRIKTMARETLMLNIFLAFIITAVSYVTLF
jgi:sodium-dependent dicarboxylate transporter 2/3/5